ncbi:hypothetical protein ACKWTF_008973 [Chironomus riparius]
MNKKNLVSVCIITAYAILLGLFIKFRQDSTECFGKNFTCIRFCSNDLENYSDEFLLKEFKKSKIAMFLEKDFKVYRGIPTCGGIAFQPLKYNKTSKRAPYYIDSKGFAEVDLEWYNQLRYCLENANDVYDGWKLFICNQDLNFQRIFHVIIIILAIILYGFILIVYSYNKDLRDFHGKWTIVLAAIQVFSHLFFPFVLYDESPNYFIFLNNRLQNGIYNLLKLSLMLIILWINVMIFHVFFTFKNFKDPKTVSYRFSNYACFVIVFVAVSGILLFTSNDFDLFLMYTFIVTLGVVVWITTGLYIYKLSRNKTHSEHPRFHFERKWFWICFRVAITIWTTYFGNFLKKQKNFNVFLYMTIDIIILFGAITVTIIMIGRTKVRNIFLGDYHKNDQNFENECHKEDLKIQLN